MAVQKQLLRLFAVTIVAALAVTHVGSPPTEAVGFTFRDRDNFCVAGGGTGLDWSWKITEKDNEPNVLEGPRNVSGVFGTAATVANAFVASINQAPNPPEASFVTEDPSAIVSICGSGPWGAVFSATASQSFDLYTGPSGNPNCKVGEIGQTAPCNFNPDIGLAPQPLPAVAPSGQWLLVGLVLLAAAVLLLRRLRQARLGTA